MQQIPITQQWTNNNFFLFSDLRVSRKCSVRRTGSSMTDYVQHVLSRAEQCPHAAGNGGTYTPTSVTCHLSMQQR